AAAAVQLSLGVLEQEQRVGRGDAFQDGPDEPAAMPQSDGVDISGAAVFDEALCVGYGEPFDLAQPEAEDTTRGRNLVRPSRRALRALLRMREVINATNNYLLILRRLRSSRLEGRTARDAAV